MAEHSKTTALRIDLPHMDFGLDEYVMSKASESNALGKLPVQSAAMHRQVQGVVGLPSCLDATDGIVLCNADEEPLTPSSPASTALPARPRTEHRDDHRNHQKQWSQKECNQRRLFGRTPCKCVSKENQRRDGEHRSIPSSDTRNEVSNGFEDAPLLGHEDQT